MKDHAEFAKCFKYWRDRLHLSQSQMAKKVKMAPSAISHFETGKRLPSMNNFIKICNGLNMSPDKLLRWDRRNKMVKSLKKMGVRKS